MIITQTPFRLSLLGGNTDYPEYFKKYGGKVLTTTIDKYLYCIVKERFDDQIWINYSIKEVVNDIKDIKHDLVREALKMLGIRQGIEITFLSDIPSEGSGLGSSSAVTVSLLNALHTYMGESVTARQLAEEACKIEIDILGKPIGMQDQYAVAFGGFNLITFDKKINVIPIYSHKLDDYMMLFYTGITRDSDKVLSKMKLDKKILDKNKILVAQGMHALEKDEIQRFGETLNKYWLLKKELNKHVSTSWIDDMYRNALYAGAYGGKIVGAGGGGFLLLVLEPEYKDLVREGLAGQKELPFRFSKYGSRVIFNIHG